MRSPAPSAARRYVYEPAPREPGSQGAGTVHHVAWSARDDAELEAWRGRVAEAGGATHADHRPHLLPLGLLPRAQRRAVRAGHPRPGLRGRRGPATAWASRWRCRRATRPCASSWSGTLTPLPQTPPAEVNGPPGLDHRLRPPRGEPEGALVLMHGRGTDEHDLFPLLDVFDPDRRLVGLTRGARWRCRRAGATGTQSSASGSPSRARSWTPGPR